MKYKRKAGYPKERTRKKRITKERKIKIRTREQQEYLSDCFLITE